MDTVRSEETNDVFVYIEKYIIPMRWQTISPDADSMTLKGFLLVVEATLHKTASGIKPAMKPPE